MKLLLDFICNYGIFTILICMMYLNEKIQIPKCMVYILYKLNARYKIVNNHEFYDSNGI